MLAQVRRLVWLAALVALLAMTGAVQAQGRTMKPARANLVNPPREEEPAEITPDVFSSVSFIDSALPRNMLRLRFDWAEGFRRPTMAEYFQPKGGLPFTPGPPRPETGLDYQDWTTYLEFAPDKWFSVFAETPVRWLNPDMNENVWGQGDLSLGLKVGVFTEERFLATFQLKTYLPTARHSALGTDHFTVEPGLLAAWRIADCFQLEGEVRYWVPVGGTDFAGDILRYGLGLSYGQQSANEVWITPVIEVVGWTLNDGKALRVTPTGVGIDDVSGQTLINAHAGIRLGLGMNADFYAGYSRAITGPRWHRELFRFEVRWLY